MADDSSNKNPWGASAPPWLGDLLKKAVSMGAEAYSSAEGRVQKTLSTVQAPINFSKDMVKEVIESLLDSYSININAKIDFVSKKKKSTSPEEKSNG